MPRTTEVEVFHYGTRVRPGLPVPFAIALSISTSPYPHLRATIQSLAAMAAKTPTTGSWPHATKSPKTQMNPLLMTTFMESVV